ncbi:hypothetical protein UlMin_025943 [Ulmus minor]
MMTYKLDPDVERWGLHLLDVCILSNDISRSTVTGFDTDSSRVEYVREGYAEPSNLENDVREGYVEPSNLENNFREGYVESSNLENDVREGYVEPSNLENDEVIAHAYQEELSRLASVEASGRHDLDVENFQASILGQDWLGPSKRHEHDNGWKMENGYDRQGNTDDHNTNEISANDYGRSTEWELNDHGQRRNEEVENGLGTVITYSNPTEIPGESSINEEHWSHLWDIRDEFSLDGEVGRRLNEIVPVPHVPRTIEKIPSVDEEISDHERLLERLQLYDLVERKVLGDGNCQFRSLSDQLYRSADHHGVVREQIVQQLRNNPKMYEAYVPMAYADYLKKMSKNGEWGDHVTLQAAADKYGVKIFVITSFKDTCSIEILPHIQKSNRVIFLSFWAEVHYNSIYPEGDLPPPSTTKKKKWWNFIN